MERLSLTILALVAVCSFACRAQKVDNSTVGSLIPERYLGKWYEIARFDHSFERGLEFASAEYSMMENGMIKVVNRGVRNGTRKTAEGKARFTDTPGLLRVSFFGPFYSDYRVMMLSENYDYALVGSKTGKYLWILSRTKQLPTSAETKILNEATSRGYNIEDLIWVRQSPDSDN